jgi:hypothetical protein
MSPLRSPRPQGEEGAQAEGETEQVGKGEGGQDHVGAGAVKEHQDRRCESEEVSDPIPHQDEEKGCHRCREQVVDELVGHLRFDPKDREHRLVEQDREGHQVAVVGGEQGFQRPRAVGVEVAPLVNEGRQAPGQVEQHEGRGKDRAAQHQDRPVALQHELQAARWPK